ncbi:hypothetical protein [uncultured Brachyspira sp.]|uniref:hypothetical protein n=1 Tax=uncultured Brachyspira sp. TaxID=221953 RepID=UPI002618A4CF|nr:hypothetical protein [uncultured Brachyspira sp.]
MKIDYNLIKNILQFINNNEFYQIKGYDLSKEFDCHCEYKRVSNILGTPNKEDIEKEKLHNKKINNFLSHIQLLYDNRCLGINAYPEDIRIVNNNNIRIMPNGYELLYILNNFDITQSIEKNIPISIIIKKYKNEI